MSETFEPHGTPRLPTDEETAAMARDVEMTLRSSPRDLAEGVAKMAEDICAIGSKHDLEPYQIAVSLGAVIGWLMHVAHQSNGEDEARRVLVMTTVAAASAYSDMLKAPT